MEPSQFPNAEQKLNSTAVLAVKLATNDAQEVILIVWKNKTYPKYSNGYRN
jgi:hypothetical protein